MKAALALSALMLWPAPLMAQAVREVPGSVLHSVIQLPPLLPDEDAQAAAAQGEIVCRPPQRMTESRMLGPKVCRPKAVWDELHRQGLDIAADGRGTVQSEKYRVIQTCGRGSC